MHGLIAALAGLSMTGGVAAPLITNQVQNTNKTSVTPLASQRISLGGVQKISTNQSSKTWEITFDLGPNWSGSLRHINFEGGGLRSYVAWGSWTWNYGWPTREVYADSQKHEIFRDGNSSGLATQKAALWYTLDALGGSRYHLAFEFFTQSYNSFTSCTGTLTIGDALTFTN